MPKPGHNIHIPLREAEAVALLGRVRPTEDMPRPGASKAKKTTRKTPKRTAKRSGNRV